MWRVYHLKSDSYKRPVFHFYWVSFRYVFSLNIYLHFGTFYKCYEHYCIFVIVYHLESDSYKRPVSTKPPIKCESSAKDIQHGFRDIIQKSSALEHLGPWGHRIWFICVIWLMHTRGERWGAGVETQNNVRGEIGGWGRVPFNETYAPLLSTIYDGA